MKISTHWQIIILCIIIGLATLALSFGVQQVKPTRPTPMAEMQEPPLPRDLTEAWNAIETRRMGDMLSGMERSVAETKHQERLQEFKKMQAEMQKETQNTQMQE